MVKVGNAVLERWRKPPANCNSPHPRQVCLSSPLRLSEGFKTPHGPFWMSCMVGRIRSLRRKPPANFPLSHRAAPGSEGQASRMRRGPFLPRLQCLQNRRDLAAALVQRRHPVAQRRIVRRSATGADLALILQQAHVAREVVPAFHCPVPPVQSQQPAPRRLVWR